MITRTSSFLVRQRVTLFFCSLILVIGAAIGIKDARITSDYKIFFSENDQHFQSFQELESTYTSALNVIFILAPKNRNVFTPENLTAIRWLSSQSWKIPYSVRVDSITNFQYTSSSNDELIVADLVPDSFKDDQVTLGEIRKRALSEPLIQHRLISPTGDATAMVVTFEVPNQTDPTPDLSTIMGDRAGVNPLIDQFRKDFPDIEIKVSGTAAMNYAFLDVAGRDLLILMPALTVIMLALIGLMTRSISNTIITQIIILAAMIATIGITANFGVTFNNISGIAPTIIMTLAVADCVHLLSYYSQHLREGISKEEAMRVSLASNARAVFLTSFTTAVGFLGMNSSDSPPYVDLGNIAAGGIILAYIFSHTMLPALAIWFSSPHSAPEQDVNRRVMHIADRVIANPRPYFFYTLVVSIVISGFMFLNKVNDENIGYFRNGTEVRDAFDFAEAKGFPMNLIEFSFDTGKSYGITDIEYLKQIEAFTDWAKQQPEVIQATSFVDVLKRLNENMNGADTRWNRLPDSKELAAQYLLLYEMSLPMGMDTNNQINTKKSALRVTIQTKILKAQQNIALEQRAQTWLAQNTPLLKANGTSPMLMFAHIGQKNINSLMLGTALSVAIICLCMIFGLGSVKLGILAILPNVFPSTIMLGLWGLLVGEVNLGVAIVFTVTTGIIVDDTIHLFSKVAEGLERGFDIDTAIRYSFQHASRGVIITTAALSAGFSILIFSDFMLNVTLGIMVSATICIAIVFDMIFMPSVLKIFYKTSTQKQIQDDVSKSDDLTETSTI